MKKISIIYIVLSVMFLFTGLSFTQSERDGRHGRGMREGFGRERPMDIGGYEMMAGYTNADFKALMQKHIAQIDEVISNARQAKSNLTNRRRNILVRLDDLATKYWTDKSLSKDIISTLKELNSIQTQIQAINQDAMDKIQKLNAQREKDINAINDAWLKQVENNPAELDSYVKFINNRPRKMMDRGRD